MLRLTIKPFEKLFIGKDITVENLSETRMKVGVNAPKEIPIHRENAKRKAA